MDVDVLEAPTTGRTVVLQPRHTDLVLDALKSALADSREHRLFQSGKLPGLFPFRHGAAADAALFAIKEGLFETVRTEAKGKLVVEWVRVTPKGVGFVHDHDSPRAVLKELQSVIGATKSGVPVWMDDVRSELSTATAKFEERAKAMTAQLEELAWRVEAALRRVDATGPKLTTDVAELVPWGETALAYMDRRSATGASSDCPLNELFHAVSSRFPPLTLPDFHDGLRRLHDNRALKLCGPVLADGPIPPPEYAILIGSELCHYAGR